MKSRFTFCSLLFSLILLGGCSGSSSSGSSGSVPLIYSFVAMPSTVDLGESVELSWSANGATSYSISGMSGAVTSPLTVSPPATTTYTLTATNAEGSAFASTVVTVNRQPPTISNFTATPSTISQGASSGLSWSVSNATSVTLSGISGTASSPTVVSPATSTTYTLTAANAAGSITAQATVTVTPAISVSIAPGNMTLSSGASGSFTASVLNDAQNAGVNWSLGGGLGTLLSATSTSVLYYAPAELPAASSATLTATSKSDTTKSASVTITLSAPTAPASQWVYYDTTGKLNYKPLNAHGDQIMDFSTAGYEQGAVVIPTVAVAANVSPSGGDDTASIQAAINTVAAMSLNTTTGLRGAVLLAPGKFTVSSSLNINASGVVLRGSGSGSGGTQITMLAAGTPYPLVVVSGSGSPVASGSATTITDSYVPSGTLTLSVAGTAGLAVGTNIIIERPVTSSWVSFMDMTSTDLGSGDNWISVGSTGLTTERTITAINGTQITLDAPMSDSIDNTYCSPPGGTLYPYTYSGRISQVGVENFSAVAPAVIGVVGDPTYQLVTTKAVANAWIRNLTAQDTLQSVDIESESKQLTVSNVAITHTITQTGSAQFEEFYISGSTQILMDSVSTTADDMYFFATSSQTQGPNVLRNGSFAGDMTVEPHQRWATGLLVENTHVVAGPSTQGGIKFRDRGDYGTGHGWTVGWGVVWNSSGASMVIQQPPGSENWCIGCIGTQLTEAAPGGSTVLPQGMLDSAGTYVFPASLYQAQLTQRLGPGISAQ